MAGARGGLGGRRAGAGSGRLRGGAHGGGRWRGAPPRWLARWLPFLLWGAVWIGLLGGESFASRHTVGWVGRLLPFLPPGWLPGADFAFRKVLHFLAYGLLGWLAGQRVATSAPSGEAAGEGAATRLPRGEAPGKRAGRLAAVAALLVAVALLDEGHQQLVRGRHPSPVDMLIDAAGAGAGLLLASVGVGGRPGRALARPTRGRPEEG